MISGLFFYGVGWSLLWIPASWYVYYFWTILLFPQKKYLPWILGWIAAQITLGIEGEWFLFIQNLFILSIPLIKKIRPNERKKEIFEKYVIAIFISIGSFWVLGLFIEALFLSVFFIIYGYMIRRSLSYGAHCISCIYFYFYMSMYIFIPFLIGSTMLILLERQKKQGGNYDRSIQKISFPRNET
jgi:hypothetical protein